MTTKNEAPVRADDDGPELAAIASDVRPAVDAGKGRALAFAIVAALLDVFGRRTEARAHGAWFGATFDNLAAWFSRALDVESGEEQKREIGQRLTLLDVAGMADRIASAALCQARAGLPVPFERWVVFDIATALRRACGCSSERGRGECFVCGGSGNAEGEPCTDCLGSGKDWNSPEWEHARAVLLPLLIRDARRLCLAAKVDAGPIEAAIARHGGRPS